MGSRELAPDDAAPDIPDVETPAKHVYVVHVSTVIELDDRRRLSLGKIGRHSRYVVTEQPDGTIVMEPAVVVTKAEAQLLAMPELIDRIENSQTRPEQYRPRASRAERLKRAEQASEHLQQV